MEDFWLKQAEQYSEKGFEINNLGTHPEIIKWITKYKIGKTILDYGCGDGELIYKLGTKYSYTIYDISETMLDLAKKKLEGYKLNICHLPDKIPENYFDIAILSMVLICVDKIEEFNFIINILQKSKKKDGICIIAIPHPCFRNEPFSSYFTEFSIGKKFDYFENGQPHSLTIRNTGISFKDHNWTLSFVLNTLINFNFQLIEIIELKDNLTNEYYNPLSSPSIILICK